MNATIGIIGLGFVGGNMMKSFIDNKIKLNEQLFVYDKYKDGGIGTFNDMLNVDILFLALPTQFDVSISAYNMLSIHETLQLLDENSFNGIIVIKSTINPNTIKETTEQYNLKIIHNPEFLRANHAYNDFHYQKYIVIGSDQNHHGILLEFYNHYYPDAKIVVTKSGESEMMKIVENSFAAVKIQFFTEIYLLCQKVGIEYDKVRDIMCDNGKVNYNHTTIPGPDGSISYGGYCYPKDTCALLHFMKSNNTPNDVLSSVINERNQMRIDNINIKNN